MSKSLREICRVLISLIYAYLFARLPHELFKDRGPYLSYITDSASKIDNYLSTGGVIKLLSNEPLFLYFNKFMYESLYTKVSPELILKGYVFWISFIFCLFLLHSRKSIFLALFSVALFLCIPFSYMIQLTALRQGLGLSIILLALILGLKVNGNKLLTLVFIMGFVHSSIFIMFVLLIVDRFHRKLSFFNDITSRVIYQISVALIMSILGLKVASILGMRQGEEYSMVFNNVSGYSFLMYFLILITLLINYKGEKSSIFLQNNTFFISISGIIFYLSAYWFSPLAGRMISLYIIFITFNAFYKINFNTIIVFFVILIVNIPNFIFGQILPSMNVPFYEFLQVFLFEFK